MSGDYHRLIGRVEHAVHQVKQMLTSAFRGTPCKTLFSLYHRLAIVESWINERPSFQEKDWLIAPNDFERAVLRRAPQSHTDEVLLSDLVFPPNGLVKTALDTMATENRVFLTRLAGDTSQKLLNYKPNKNNIQVGDAVYIADKITKYKPSVRR